MMLFEWGICFYTLTKLFKLLFDEFRVVGGGYCLIKMDGNDGKFGTWLLISKPLLFIFSYKSTEHSQLWCLWTKMPFVKMLSSILVCALPKMLFLHIVQSWWPPLAIASGSFPSGHFKSCLSIPFSWS